MSKLQSRRFILTINNPFWENVEVDNSLQVKENFYKLDYLKDNKNCDLFEFHLVEKEFEENGVKTKMLIERPFFKNIDCVYKFVENLEHIKYSMFQLEKGENEGTYHIQMFLVFSIGKRFSTIKTYFPTAHFEDVKGSNIQCRDYCSKSETRVEGPFEYGEFAEERARTDVKGFIELVKAGTDLNTLFNLYPSLALRNYERIEKIRQQEKLQQVLHNGPKNMDVTFIYGPPGTGKTTFAYEKCGGYPNAYRVTKYNNGSFDNYNGEDYIIFDEFSGKFSIEDMNNYLDIHPCVLPARFSNKVALYTKVYIISNLSLKELYQEVQEAHPWQYEAFLRRIHNVIRIDKGHNVIYEKSNNVSQQLSLSDSDLKELEDIGL